MNIGPAEPPDHHGVLTSDVPAPGDCTACGGLGSVGLGGDVVCPSCNGYGRVLAASADLGGGGEPPSAVGATAPSSLRRAPVSGPPMPPAPGDDLAGVAVRGRAAAPAGAPPLPAELAALFVAPPPHLVLVDGEAP